MSCCSRSTDLAGNPELDYLKDLYHVQRELRTRGLESCTPIFGIDYTSSNGRTGYCSFAGNHLHSISDTSNFYQQVIQSLGKALEPFDKDKLIHAFGFGDTSTASSSVFPFYPDRPCYTFQDVLDRYASLTATVDFGGPTSFAPIIQKAIEIVKKTPEFHILVIITDSQLSSQPQTRQAILEASDHPLSILVVGVGDGPWNPKGQTFENYRFVPYEGSECSEAQFASRALAHVPGQYRKFREQFSHTN